MPPKTTALVLAGAVAVATAGYGIGSTGGDGSALAGGGQAVHEARGFGNLAETLGVDEEELAQALRDFHEQNEGERRDDMTAALAEALGSSPERVRAALEQLHDRHETRFAKRLAAALGADAAELRAALDELHGDRPRDPVAFAGELAEKLGLETGDVRRALIETRPEGRHGPHHGRLPLRQLAAALDVSRGELRKAFRELRAGAENGWEERTRALARFLAGRFELDAAAVEAALGEPGPPHGGPRMP